MVGKYCNTKRRLRLHPFAETPVTEEKRAESFCTPRTSWRSYLACTVSGGEFALLSFIAPTPGTSFNDSRKSMNSLLSKDRKYHRRERE
jgi:hypothetical protein